MRGVEDILTPEQAVLGFQVSEDQNHLLVLFRGKHLATYPARVSRETLRGLIALTKARLLQEG